MDGGAFFLGAVWGSSVGVFFGGTGGGNLTGELYGLFSLTLGEEGFFDGRGGGTFFCSTTLTGMSTLTDLKSLGSDISMSHSSTRLRPTDCLISRLNLFTAKAFWTCFELNWFR